MFDQIDDILSTIIIELAGLEQELFSFFFFLPVSSESARRSSGEGFLVGESVPSPNCKSSAFPAPVVELRSGDTNPH